jgi:hypothetical protein
MRTNPLRRRAGVGCIALVAAVPLALAEPVTVTMKQCGVVQLTLVDEAQDSSEHARVYNFKESGEATQIGMAQPPSLWNTPGLKYACDGALLTAEITTLGTTTTHWKWAGATCTYEAGQGNRFRAKVTTEGTSVGDAPPHPPVLLEVLGGSGAFATLKGKGKGNGSLPITERAGRPPTCMQVTWKFITG